MNINIYIEDELAAQLNEKAQVFGKSRSAIVREAIKEWILSHKSKSWPKSVLKFSGCPEFRALESFRSELLQPDEDPFE